MQIMIYSEQKQLLDTSLFDEWLSHSSREIEYGQLSDPALLYLFLHDEPKLGKKRTIQTKRTYLTDLLPLLQFAENRGGLRLLSASDIATYQTKLSLRFKPATVRKKSTVMKQFLKYAYRKGYLEIDITKDMKYVALREDEAINRDLYHHEFEQISTYLKEHDFLVYVLFNLLTSTGMRIKELVTAKWKDLEYYPPVGRHFLKVIGKGSKPRDIHLFRDAFELICKLRALKGLSTELNPNDETAFFPKTNGGHYHPESLSSRFTRVIKKSNLDCIKYRKDPITPHTCRHYTAAYMVDKGVDIRAVQDMLGHSSVTTTEKYLWRIRKRENHAGVKLGELFHQ